MNPALYQYIMRPSIQEIEAQIQHLRAQVYIMNNTVALLNAHREHLEAIEKRGSRMCALLSRRTGSQVLNVRPN